MAPAEPSAGPGERAPLPPSEKQPASSLAALPPPTTPPVILGSGPTAGFRLPTGAAVPRQRPADDPVSAAPPAGGAGADADAMLAELAATEGHRRGALADAMSSPLYRYLAAGAATVLLLGAFLLVSLVLVRLTG